MQTRPPVGQRCIQRIKNVTCAFIYHPAPSTSPKCARNTSLTRSATLSPLTAVSSCIILSLFPPLLLHSLLLSPSTPSPYIHPPSHHSNYILKIYFPSSPLPLFVSLLGDERHYVSDVTARYASNWCTGTRSRRLSESWWREVLQLYAPSREEREREEDDIMSNYDVTCVTSIALSPGLPSTPRKLATYKATSPLVFSTRYTREIFTQFLTAWVSEIYIPLLGTP